MAYYVFVVLNNTWTINGYNPIASYSKAYHERKQAEYKAWYDSLTDEEKEALERKKERERKRREREAMQFMAETQALMSVLSSFASYGRRGILR